MALVCFALLFAVAAGAFLTWALLDSAAIADRRRVVRMGPHADAQSHRFASSGAAAYLLRILMRREQQMACGSAVRIVPKVVTVRNESKLQQQLLFAGLDQLVSKEAYAQTRIRTMLAGLLLGGLLGASISTELTLLLSVAGAFGGWMSPSWALRQEVEARAACLQKDLPEMLEVVALGLRSGMSFDRSFELYPQHFHTVFASSCAAAMGRWSIGLETREASLRYLVSQYQAPILGRVVESMVRSLRFGTSLAEVLEEAADESRAEYRAARQEQVAKAPVKMMVPTGTLILPAMLLLVLGPVLLELMAGF